MMSRDRCSLVTRVSRPPQFREIRRPRPLRGGDSPVHGYAALQQGRDLSVLVLNHETNGSGFGRLAPSERLFLFLQKIIRRLSRLQV